MRYNSLLFRYNGIVFRYNGLLFRYNGLVFCYGYGGLVLNYEMNTERCNNRFYYIMVTAGVLKRHNHFCLIMSFQFSEKIRQS